MKHMITENFLLENRFSEALYHDYAKNLPIIDYHNHLPPNELAAQRQYQNLTQIWMEDDHYKWRAMRILGIPERFITGDAPDREKFRHWAKTVPCTFRNPLYHWTHLELKRYFDIDECLTGENADAIYDYCNGQLKQPGFTAPELLVKMNVELVCTTDDPTDTLEHHGSIRNAGGKPRVLPAFRPDRLVHLEKPDFVDYLEQMSLSCGFPIQDWESLVAGIQSRMEYFHNMGCRLSDHGLSHAYGEPCSDSEADRILKARIQGAVLGNAELHGYKSAIMHLLGMLYAEKEWVMQLHMGALRDVNQGLLEKVGPNVGVDSIGDYRQAEELGKFLNALEIKGKLPKTVLYNQNSTYNEVFATMAGNFTQEHIRSKVQFGAAWWFLDQKDGITKQIDALSNMGLLSCSIGMLTDSRSFLSFPRHEYYRRILCNILGTDIQKGELPQDLESIGKMVQDICYYNAKAYFNFG